MEFIKKHKMLAIFITALLIFLLIILFVLKQFMYDTNKSEYGNRLDGINQVEIDKTQINKIETELAALEKVKSVKYDLKGRLVNILIVVQKDTSLDEAKERGNKVLEYLDDDQKSYYDIQIFVSNEDDSVEGYPFIGYKHKTQETVAWN